MNDFAICMQDQGNYAEARSMYEQVYNTQKRILGDDNPSTIITINNLVHCLCSQGEYKDAYKMIQILYEKSKKVLGDFHGDTLHCKQAVDILKTLCEE